MKTTALTSDPLRTRNAIVTRTAGRQYGPVKRLVSPSDLGGVLKPFVFLDYFDSSVESEMRFSMHPHSGLATTTVLLEGEVEYEDTTGASGIMPSGGVEWMNAGKGVWHDGRARGDGPVRGYQLWVALPPELELGAPRSQYLSASEVPHTGPARVILGCYQLPARKAFGRRAVAVHATGWPRGRLAMCSARRTTRRRRTDLQRACRVWRVRRRSGIHCRQRFGVRPRLRGPTSAQSRAGLLLGSYVSGGVACG
jgi:redox-sensitive bicupin YhaK (pirin superfamily)